MSPVVFPDADYVRLALEEPKYFWSLEQRHRRAILHYVEHQFPKMKKMGLAEDAVDEAFLRASRNLRKLEEPHRFYFWIRGIAYNVGREYLRKIKNRHQAEITATKEREAYMVSASAPADADDVTREIIRKELERLPTKDKELIELVFYEKRTLREIAKKLEVSPSTVHERLERLYENVRARLKDYGREEYGHTRSWGADSERNTNA